MGIVTIGLKKIEVAPLAADGGPGTVFKTIGFTSKGTFSFQEEDGTIKKVDVEEASDPLKIFKKSGARSVVFSLADPDNEALEITRGGTVTTAAGEKTYTEDEGKSFECTLRITPEEGFKTIQYNSVSLYGKMEGGLGSEQELLLNIKADIQKPSKAGVKVMEVVQEVTV